MHSPSLAQFIHGWYICDVDHTTLRQRLLASEQPFDSPSRLRGWGRTGEPLPGPRRADDPDGANPPLMWR